MMHLNLSLYENTCLKGKQLAVALLVHQWYLLERLGLLIIGVKQVQNYFDYDFLCGTVNMQNYVVCAIIKYGAKVIF